MRAHVEGLRQSVDKKRKGGHHNKEEEVVPGLSMPNYVYEGCSTRFTAAKESNKKAEASVFSDTGLMALTCRHDRVLFMVNLKDAGEKQYNALALLERLFKELPTNWQVGVCYDIGCQLHRSITKVPLHQLIDVQYPLTYSAQHYPV